MPDIIDRLLDGFKSFSDDKYRKDPREAMKKLVEDGQDPDVLVIACSDSRSGPGTIFQADPGEIFVGRHIAALVPPYDPERKGCAVAAEIEFAIESLQVKHIVVLGHTECGGVKGLVSGLPDGPVGEWMQQADDVLTRTRKKCGPAEPEKIRKTAEKESIAWSVENLMTYPAVKKAVKEGKLQLHGWQFDMAEGSLKAYDPATKEFVAIGGADKDAQCNDNAPDRKPKIGGPRG